MLKYFFPNSDMSTKNLRFLSSEQALADLAYFIEAKKKELQLPHNKWIVFGGSYPGSLAAWFRLKYPHLAHGAVASSAPLLAKINFKGSLLPYTVNLNPKFVTLLEPFISMFILQNIWGLLQMPYKLQSKAHSALVPLRKQLQLLKTRYSPLVLKLLRNFSDYATHSTSRTNWTWLTCSKP